MEWVSVYCNYGQCHASHGYLCLLASSTANQQFSGSMTIRYLPTDGTNSVPDSCINYYLSAIPDSRITSTSILLGNLCNLQIGGDLEVNVHQTGVSGSIGTSGNTLDNLVGV